MMRVVNSKQAGKASPLVIVSMISLVVIVVLYFVSGSSPKTVTDEFMVALAKGETDKLVKLSYIEGSDPTKLREAWDFSTQVAAPYYRFIYRVAGATQADDNSASVTVYLNRGAGSEEKFAIELIKIAGEWKVDVSQINRSMYPALPR